MKVKFCFLISKCNPLRRSCVSIARNAGKVAISDFIQRSCTRGPTGSRCRHHDREILHKRPADRDLAQEVLQDPDADIMTERSWTRDPHTEILHNWSYRTLMQTSCQRDLGQDPQTEILHKKSYTILMQTA